jgi:hypothetical protein
MGGWCAVRELNPQPAGLEARAGCVMWLTIYAERHKRVHPRAIVMDMTVNVPSTWVTPLDAWGAWLRAADRPVKV